MLERSERARIWGTFTVKAQHRRMQGKVLSEVYTVGESLSKEKAENLTKELRGMAHDGWWAVVWMEERYPLFNPFRCNCGKAATWEVVVCGLPYYVCDECQWRCDE